ncbi:MAG: hypothetical protein PHF84_09040 [bacterium]|nr:hypothetical protein [bacterium]
MNKRWICFFFLISCLPAFSLKAEEGISENDLFSDEPVVVDSRKVEETSISSNMDKERTTLSGNIYNRTLYDMQRKWVRGDAAPSVNQFFTYLEGNIFLDVRLRKGIKAFVDLSAYYSPQGQVNTVEYSQVQFTNNGIKTNKVSLLETVNTVVLFKEFFVDANIRKAVYLRTGKQVLQWGRGYFWNPTDLINVEKRRFLEMDRYREGTFGTKIHVPFGSSVNIYGFLDYSDVRTFNDLAVAGKVEFIIVNTEIAFSSWTKEHYLPLYGFDFSTRLLTLDLYGESSFSYGENRNKLRIVREEVPFIGNVTRYIAYREKNKWIPKVTLGLTRSFDWTIPDRITVTGEFFYNHSGYYENMLEDRETAQYFTASGFYEANYYSVYYGALFITVNRIFIDELSLSLNGIGNFNDKSYILSTGLNYNPTYNFTISLLVSGYMGNGNREYTKSGNALSAEIDTAINF